MTEAAGMAHAQFQISDLDDKVHHVAFKCYDDEDQVERVEFVLELKSPALEVASVKRQALAKAILILQNELSKYPGA